MWVNETRQHNQDIICLIVSSFFKSHYVHHFEDTLFENAAAFPVFLCF